MTSLLFRDAALGPLRGSYLDLTPGRYVLFSSERDAVACAMAIAGGREAPRSGSVTLAGDPPVSSPEARRRIATLFEDETLPPAKTVLESVRVALAGRRENDARAEALLAEHGLMALASAAPARLSERERRGVSLALALAHDAAALLVLQEPLTAGLSKTAVLDALDRHTARGAIVLTSTTSSADAALLGGAWLCVELGRLKPAPAATPRLGGGPWQQLLVEASDARALSLSLHGSKLALSIEAGATPSTLRICGPALEVTAREVIAHARSERIEIRRIEASIPPVEALMAARAGFARGAYEAARTAALEPPRTVTELPPRSDLPPPGGAA